ncbi:MAG: HigA family addiction module antidote protein [Gammaproteobacteria bacterium]|nr:HigA family addiction module antidote protein [Gammaproteobacteria bacterium]MBT8437193.1 HigA family addiction module antidote protein [Gammaproteobacteria bacterium]
MLDNIHPGEVLMEEFLQAYGISQNRLGREIGMSPRAINEIVHGKRSITANSALRIAKFFGTSPEFWLNLQTSYDLEEAAKTVDLKGIKAVLAGGAGGINALEVREKDPGYASKSGAKDLKRRGKI